MTRKRSASWNKSIAATARPAKTSTENIVSAGGDVNENGTGHDVSTPGAPVKDCSYSAMSLPGIARQSSEQVNAAASPDILIEIDSTIAGRHVHDRFDVAIRGQVVSPSLIEQITLRSNNGVHGIASFRQPEDAPAAAIPDSGHAHQRGFQFNLPRSGDGCAEQCAFQVIVRTTDGLEQTENFCIDIDPYAAQPVSIVSGRAGLPSGAADPDAIMYIERGSIDPDGKLLVQGWAVSLHPFVAVQVFADDMLVGNAVAGQGRDDVAAAFPAYPNARVSGFSLTLQLDGSQRDMQHVCARLVCLHGSGHAETIPVERSQQPFEICFETGPRIADDPLSGASPISGLPPAALAQHPSGLTEAVAHAGTTALAGEVSPADVRLFCDVAELTGDGNLTVSGWAVCEAGIAQVRVLLDDTDLDLASYGHERSDVGASFPGVRMAHLSGFKFERHIGEYFEGEHDVRIVVRNNRDEEAEQQIRITATAVAVAPGPAAEPELTPEQDSEFRFELDAPLVSNGVAVALVTGRLTIDGWLLTRSGIASFEVFLDDQRLGDVHYGLARQDVGSAFPEWPNALRSGYAFHCPPRSLRDGDHTIRLRIRSHSGQEISRVFGITVKTAEDQQDSFGIRRRIPRGEVDMMSALLAEMNFRPAFQFILHQDHVFDADRLRATLDALQRQAYPYWNVLVLSQDAVTTGQTKAVIDDLVPHLSDRFLLISPANVERWNAPLARSEQGQSVFHFLLRPGDELAADALLDLAVAGGRRSDRDMLYADEVRISPVSKDMEPFYKPDFSVDLLLSTNYIGRPWVVTAALLSKTGATPVSLMSDGEYDLVLRCTELAAGIHHVPKLLCQRSDVELDDVFQEQTALERMLERRGIAADVLATSIAGTWRVKRAVPLVGRISIIIPTCAAHGYIETCINSLRAKTAYRDFEIICIDNIPKTNMAWKVWLQQNADKVVEIPDAFNWSIFNNRAAEIADGEFLLFLNDDMEIVQEDWLDAMMEHARRPEVGVIGPQLLYRDGKVQHAGMFLANNGIGRHAFRFASNDDPCYFGLALTQRNVMAVTGACMLVRRDIFTRLGGFDEAHEIVNNDLDFCLRAHRSGLLTVFTPYATLIHYELASRANMKDVFDLTHFNAAWKTTFAAGDPYFNPRLSRHADDYRPDDEPVQSVVAGAPMFRASEIQRILVVKLDHIGDFVTALPPIRRLKKLFPQARVTVLAGPASRAFIALEPCIDEFVPFAFFHARSQLGERKLTREDYDQLGAQLGPYRFDLAVDLRKQPSTRDILKHTGARYLAGFDYLGQFPFLDIALDWDGDRTLQRKRSHIVDDLMMLVNAIGYASEADRVLMQPGPAALPLTDLPEDVRILFAKPVVAVHPGAGNVTKQWPAEHFSALIDLLIEKNDVNIMLIGGPDEVEVADTLLNSVLHPDAVASMAGKTSLSDLPGLLKNCVLYIGNDSGPKHIAAAVGIPTVGIHSGVVDPVEWGPIGPNAVALRRNMTCSPCYLAKAEDCPRSLACLRFLEPNLVYETADLLLTRTRQVHDTVVEAKGPAYVELQMLEKIVSDTVVTTDTGATVLVQPTPKGKVKRRQSAAEPA